MKSRLFHVCFTFGVSSVARGCRNIALCNRADRTCWNSPQRSTPGRGRALYLLLLAFHIPHTTIWVASTAVGKHNNCIAVSECILRAPFVPLCGQVRAAGAIGLASMVAAGVTAAYVTTAIPDKELRYVLAGTPRGLICLTWFGSSCCLVLATQRHPGVAVLQRSSMFMTIGKNCPAAG